MRVLSEALGDCPQALAKCTVNGKAWRSRIWLGERNLKHAGEAHLLVITGLAQMERPGYIGGSAVILTT